MSNKLLQYSIRNKRDSVPCLLLIGMSRLYFPNFLCTKYSALCLSALLLYLFHTYFILHSLHLFNQKEGSLCRGHSKSVSYILCTFGQCTAKQIDVRGILWGQFCSFSCSQKQKATNMTLLPSIRKALITKTTMILKNGGGIYIKSKRDFSDVMHERIIKMPSIMSAKVK